MQELVANKADSMPGRIVWSNTHDNIRASSRTHRMVLSVFKRNHWGTGRFWRIFLARVRLVRKDFCDGMVKSWVFFRFLD